MATPNADPLTVVAHTGNLRTNCGISNCAPAQCPSPGRFTSLLDAQLAEQRRRNAEDVASLQRLVASGEITRVVVEVVRG